VCIILRYTRYKVYSKITFSLHWADWARMWSTIKRALMVTKQLVREIYYYLYYSLLVFLNFQNQFVVPSLI